MNALRAARRPRALACLARLVALVALASPALALAVDADALRRLAADDFDEKGEAIAAIAATPGPMTLPVLKALQDGALRVDGRGAGWIVGPAGAIDALTGRPAALPSPEPDEVTINNRLRGRLDAALATLRLSAPDRATRLAAAEALQDGEEDALREPLRAALATESDPAVRSAIALAAAAIDLRADDPALRLEAARTLAAGDRGRTRTLLAARLERGADGVWVEPDASVRAAASAALAEVSARLERAEWFGRIFAGLSLGSILMLAAIGLAITYGLLGVINMAHGEMLMIGAYATYATQAAFRAYAPDAFAWYPVVALPVAFGTAAAVGIAVERTVIRWLYGRPLETLLATWGVSLILIQAVRQLFGPQNVEIENPAWLSGGVQLGSLVLPWNRIVIIGFSLAVLAGVALVLARTRLGLFVRGVTQNRGMASAIGVPTDRIDMLAFGLGSGIAGLAGVALSQVGNVGPELGQAYVIDSFIVVVLGGVGQLMGTVVAGFGLGVANKLLEPWLGAVVAKILILALIVAFIQKRPSGLFALKGRLAET
ncbi:MAG TPA: urea ABC transporter permease subunit UrtB [Burkholderiaceae bacterium]|nr:urea ABC transporter permease subunit UrtB [Burkholderiaceae bacterium]